MAEAAAMLASVFCLLHISIVLNIRDKKAEKSSSLSVGRCFGFRVMAPVVGSIIICWSPDIEEDTTIPRVEPGEAIYGRRLALGVPSLMVIICRLALKRCFLTRISSWENAHSSADIKAVVVDVECRREGGGCELSGGGDPLGGVSVAGCGV